MKDWQIFLLIVIAASTGYVVGIINFPVSYPSLTCVQSVVHNDKAVCAVYVNKELKK